MPSGNIYDISVILEEELIRPDSYEEVQTVLSVYARPYMSPNAVEERITDYDFITTLDYDDVTILQCPTLKYYMNEEQEDYWKNHTRMI